MLCISEFALKSDTNGHSLESQGNNINQKIIDGPKITVQII